MKNKIIVSAFLCLLLVSLVLALSPIKHYGDVTKMSRPLPQYSVTPTEDICMQIRGTPAWVQDGIIIDYSYKEKWDSVEDLILSRTQYLYNPDCGYCQLQKDLWGDDWQKYQASGLTTDCREVWRRNN